MRRYTIAGIIIFILGATFFILSRNLLLNNSSSIKIADTKEKVSFMVFGDSGTGSEKQRQLAKIMLEYPFDFILHTGDVAYPYGSEENYKNFFFDIYNEHLSKAKFYPSPGNHDYQSDQLASYTKLFGKERYYSFDVGNIHFVSLDTNDISTDQLVWLKNDLEKAKDQVWTIVYFHHPPYSSGLVHGGDPRVRRMIVPILEEYGVELVFSGHEHNYERTCKIKDDKCSEDGVTYIVTGGGGAPLYQFGEGQYFTASRSATHHFVDTKISHCQLEGRAIDVSREITDKFVIDKC